MSFFIGVIFFCLPGDCAFWKAEQIFDTKAQCEVVISDAMDVFERNSEVAAGACLEIRMTRT